MTTQRPKQRDRPAHHANDSASAFVNPWPSAGPRTWTELWQASIPFGAYEPLHGHPHARDLRVVVPDWGNSSLTRTDRRASECVLATWLGHAAALVEFPSLDDANSAPVRLLFDPIFSTRASPVQSQGPARLKPTPCQVDGLPGCDAVLISHNHYDHLDLASIQQLRSKFPAARYFVPLGIKSWLLSIGIPEERVFELDWWDARELVLRDFYPEARRSGLESTTFKLTCVPAQHNSARSPTDQGRTLWCGWVVERFAERTRKGAVYHAGDTGYRRATRSAEVCPAFKEIGQRFGGFDVSFIPIWRGGTLGFFSYYGVRLSHHDIPAAHHASPADAIEIHGDVKSRNTIGMHFGTFVGSENETYEATIEFAQARDDHEIADLDAVGTDGARAGVIDIGETRAIPWS